VKFAQFGAAVTSKGRPSPEMYTERAARRRVTAAIFLYVVVVVVLEKKGDVDNLGNT
jgi:hypothetical protein